MIFPPPLEYGSTIGLVSPAGKIDETLIDPFVQLINAQGFKVVLGPNITNKHHQFAGTDQQRTDDLQMMLNDKNVDAIICLRGGYGTMRIVEHLDFSYLLNRPKWLVGFSDITVLHACLQNKLNMVSIHGPMAKHVVEANAQREDIKKLWHILKGGNLSYNLKSHALNRNGKAEGTLVGGNLSMLYALRGTPYDFDPNGNILFIEDLNEYLYHADRILQNLKLGGVLERLSGLIVGDFSDMKDNLTPFGQTIEEIIADAVKTYDYPVLFGFKAGHCTPNNPLIMGDKVQLSVNENCATLKFYHGRA